MLLYPSFGQSYLTLKCKSHNLNPALKGSKDFGLSSMASHEESLLPATYLIWFCLCLYHFHLALGHFNKGRYWKIYIKKLISGNSHKIWEDPLPDPPHFGSLQMVKLDEILMKNYRVICLTLPLGTLGKWDNSSQCAASLIS